ncbi:putative folate/pteridine transporter [Trypanosoma cruzi]|uniref:Putative folate/pteridine transporter n=1 Tax=Trypanosoma cruzi TaxID=5693 RepID=A0A2V2WS83_TRYCR|nr:putative folate/pteridine transporter [Trypanosoma cruzi]
MCLVTRSSIGCVTCCTSCRTSSYFPGCVRVGRRAWCTRLLAGFSNFGQAVSNTVGSLLMEFKWPVETDPAVGCDFSNVRWLLIVGHLLCPLVCVPLVFLLIPAARICDNIDVDGRVVRPQEPSGDCKVEGKQGVIECSRARAEVRAHTPPPSVRDPDAVDDASCFSPGRTWGRMSLIML